MIMLLAVAAVLAIIAAVSAWIALGIEWTVCVLVRSATLRELFALIAFWAVTFAVAAAVARAL
jgi:hypothetical protein